MSIDLHNGDCLEVMATLPDNSIDMVMTDPPYGTTACKWDSVIPLAPMWEQLKRITKPNLDILFTILHDPKLCNGESVHRRYDNPPVPLKVDTDRIAVPS